MLVKIKIPYTQFTLLVYHIIINFGIIIIIVVQNA